MQHWKVLIKTCIEGNQIVDRHIFASFMSCPSFTMKDLSVMRAKQLFGYYSLLTVGSFMIMTKCGFNTIFLDVLFRFFKESLSDGHDYCLGTRKASP